LSADNFIHWYPGHIAKAERKLKEQMQLVDAIIEVRDARLPISSAYEDIESLLGEKPRLIVLNKSDLTPAKELKEWAKKLDATPCSAKSDMSPIIKKVVELSQPRIEAMMKKGLLRRPSRVMVCGMPNVGKSSIINKLTRSSKTKTGAKAGVTRQQQWVRIHPNLELLDTPGIIPMKQCDQERAKKLTFVNAVGENAYQNEHAATELLRFLPPQALREYYKVDDVDLESIAYSRNWLKSGNEADINRTAAFVLRDFRDGRIGKFILDKAI
jgi:ribosome biogenesis GTPase A